MPNDVAIGRELASQINANYTGKITDCEFTYNTYMDFASMPDEPICWISTNNSTWDRQSRGTWMRDCELKFTLISRRGPTDNQAWIDEIIDSFDMMMDFVTNQQVLGLYPTQIEINERYEPEMFESNHRLLMESTVTYMNI